MDLACYDRHLVQVEEVKAGSLHWELHESLS